MPRQNVHDRVTKSFLGHLAIQEILNPSHELPLNDVLLQLQANIATFRKIKNTRYLQDRTSCNTFVDEHLVGPSSFLVKGEPKIGSNGKPRPKIPRSCSSQQVPCGSHPCPPKQSDSMCVLPHPYSREAEGALCWP